MSVRNSNDIDRAIGARIRMRRHELGMTQETLAGELCLSFQQVQKYEKGVNRVGGSRMTQIATKLGVDEAFFYPARDVNGKIELCPMDDFLKDKDGMRIAQAWTALNRDQRQVAALVVETLAGGSSE
jgi:transcriptional regulator with XRE-family HTH domain